MGIEAKEIVSLEERRDGGSLAVTFLDPAHTRHTLIFRIASVATESSDGVGVYQSALIESLVTADWLNSVTCVPASGTVVRKTPVTWEKAAEILSDLGPLVPGFPSGNKWVFEKMQQVLSSNLRAARCS